MKIELTVKKEFEVKYLQVEASVRYWEDTEVNGISDKEGDLIPCREGDLWKPLIELETGEILNWTKGNTASIHYKVCDSGVYKLLDDDKNIVKEIEGYVPSVMCPKEDGFGDYIIMGVDLLGKITDWNPVLDDFTNEEEDY